MTTPEQEVGPADFLLRHATAVSGSRPSLEPSEGRHHTPPLPSAHHLIEHLGEPVRAHY